MTQLTTLSLGSKSQHCWVQYFAVLVLQFVTGVLIIALQRNRTNDIIYDVCVRLCVSVHVCVCVCNNYISLNIETIAEPYKRAKNPLITWPLTLVASIVQIWYCQPEWFLESCRILVPYVILDTLHLITVQVQHQPQQVLINSWKEGRMSKQKVRFSICLIVGIWDATSSATYSQGRSSHINQSINQSINHQSIRTLLVRFATQ